MSPNSIGKVVIVGRDAAAWLSANALLRAFGPSGLKVEVVELRSLLRPHDVFMSQPALEAFHRLLGFDEHEVLKACGGAYSLGQSFVNFSGPRPSFLRPYGSHGAPVGKVGFHQIWTKAQQSGMSVSFEDFSISAVAAKQGKFFAQDNAINALFRCDYAYHLNGLAYVSLLKAQAIRLGALTRTAHSITATLDQAGGISHLHLNEGSRIDGDFYIDATGPESQLLGETLGAEVDSWSRWFPFDRLMVGAAERLKSLPCYAQARALELGCLQLAPTQNQTGLIYTYRSGIVSDDEAFRDMSVAAGIRAMPEATVAPISIGRRQKAWVKNCVAIGDAACVFDPLDSPSLYSIQLGLAHLISLFPLQTDSSIEAREYNHLMQEAFERFRDYTIAHYKLNRLYDLPLWDEARDMTVPEPLAWKLDLFAARGIVPIYDEETFQLDDWLALLLGHGQVPKTYDPLADLVPQDEAIKHVQSLLAFIREHVQDMSSHDAYLELFAMRDFA